MDNVVSKDLLETVIAGTPVTPKHKALLAALAPLSGLATVTYATRRDGYYSDDEHSYVVSPAREILGRLKDWLAAELATFNGDVRRLWDHYRHAGYFLAPATMECLYLVARQGTSPEEAIQIPVWLEQPKAQRQLFSADRYCEPPDLEHLMEKAVRDTPTVEPFDVGTPTYRLQALDDLRHYLREEARADAEQKARQGRAVLVIGEGTADETRTPFFEHYPELLKVRPKGLRLFRDWENSSAGRACSFWDHWVLVQVNYYTEAKTGHYYVSLIPGWTTEKKVVEFKYKRDETIYGLWDRLQSFDRKMKCPFAWYFYMLHGNLLQDWVGRRVLQGAEAGHIMMAEHDYQVLKAWSLHKYGF